MSETSAATRRAPIECDIVYFPLGAAAFGGAERSILELASAQQSAGKRVLVCYEPALEATDFLSQAQAMHLPLLKVDWAPERTPLQVARTAWRLFSRVRAPLVHFNISWRPSMWLIPLLARSFTRARLVGTMRAMPEPYDRIPRGRVLGFIPSPRLWMLPDMLVGRVWAHALHATVSVNRDDYPPRLKREFAFPANRLSVIYNGVRIPAQVPSDAQRQEARHALGCSEGDFIVTYVGRVSPEKGLRYAIDALSACPARVHLLVAGEGDELAELKAHANALGLGERVRFLGYVAQPFDVFTAAHVTVVPSLWNEAFGRVVVEAMACRSAVVATAVGGMRELFEHGREGLFVPKEDAMAIAAALNQLEADPAKLNAMQHAGRQLAEQRYATSRVAAENTALYARLLGASHA